MEKEFVELIEKNKKLVFKVANIYGRDEDDIKDLSQEVILQLWKSFPKYDKNYKISTWIYRIALNVCISATRKETTRKKIHSDYQKHVDIIHWDDNISDPRLKQLYRFIGNLKPFDKAILILQLEGRNNSEIAEIMGISVTNVSTRIHRIKEKLSSDFKTLKK